MVHLGVYASCRNTLPRSLPASRPSRSLGANVSTLAGGLAMRSPRCGAVAGGEDGGGGMLWLLPQPAIAAERPRRLTVRQRVITFPSHQRSGLRGVGQSLIRIPDRACLGPERCLGRRGCGRERRGAGNRARRHPRGHSYINRPRRADARQQHCRICSMKSALQTGEVCTSRLVYPVAVEQEQLLIVGSILQGRFFRGSESWTIALKRFNRTYGA